MSVSTEQKSIQDIFHQSQFSTTSHERLFKQLRKLYDKIPPEAFLTHFTHCLQVLLIHGEKLRPVENSLTFASKFIATLLQDKPSTQDETNAEEEEEEICPFVRDILKFLFENHNSEHQAIRFRACQFINKILNGLGFEACIDDNLCDQISECMMERLQDKAPAVRMQAVLALHRLQDPSDAKCPVMKAFMFHMSSDPSAEVRRAVITNIAITTQSVRCILERTHDVKDSVRRTAFIQLAKLGVQRFSINQRVRFLTDGLKDHSAMVRESVSKVMLPAWLQYYKGSFLSLLHALDCENSTEISCSALQSLFKSEPIKVVLEELTKLLNEDKVIPIEEAKPENVLYWRVLCEHLESHPEIADERPIDEPLPEIVPELSTFCNYIKQYHEDTSVKEAEHWEKLQHQYILTQLLELCKHFDLSDEMGRTNLRNLCLYLLTNNTVSEDVVPTVVTLMVKIVPNVEDRLQALAEAISEVREPMTEQEPENDDAPPPPTLSAEEQRQKEMKSASIRVKINELKEEQDDAIRQENFMLAQSLKEEYQKLQLELKSLNETPSAPSPPPSRAEARDVVIDELALRKCLRIVREMCQSETVKSLSATLRSLMQNFILPCLQEENSSVIRNKALEVLGIFCLLDKTLADENFLMFCFQIANDEVCEVALKVTFDLLLLYGLEPFQVQEESGEAAPKKKSKKKKNLFVTDMLDEDFDTEEDENPESQTTISSGSSGNTSNLIAMLTSLLDSASTSMRNLAMEGLYKLFMACRITSPLLLSRLIIMWYSPVTEGDEALRQPLGAFLHLYATNCPRSQETLEEAFLPTLKTLMQAPVTSPLTQIDQDCVARLFIKLTRQGTNKFHSNKISLIHNNLAISICNAIMDCEDSTNIGVLLRALLSLEPSFDDPVYREELMTLIKRLKGIFGSTKEKLFLRSLEKISQMIQAAAENISIRTTEVDNTAAPSQLEATQSTIVSNDSVVADAQDPSKQKKKTKILHPHMHTLISENEVEEEEEEVGASQESPVITSDIVIPASPPRCSSSDEDDVPTKTKKSSETNKKDKHSIQETGDGVFKKPLANVKSRKGRQTSRTATSTDSDTSPVAKRKKASVEESNQVLKASRNTSGRLAKKGKGEDGHENQAGTSHDIQAKRDDVMVGAESERGSKRQIHPTEKGTTLKTFQNLSSPKSQGQNLTVSSPHVTPPPKRLKKGLQEEVSFTSVVAEASSSSSPSHERSSPVRNSPRYGGGAPADRSSFDSPPASAQALTTKLRNVGKTSRNKAVQEKGSDSDASLSPSQRPVRSRGTGPGAVNKGSTTSTTSSISSSSPVVGSASPPLSTHGGSSPQAAEKKQGVRPRTTTRSKTDANKSPVPPTRSGRLRKNADAPSQTDSDSSPVPATNQRRLKKNDAPSSEVSQQSKKRNHTPKTSSSDVDSDISPDKAVTHKGRQRQSREQMKGITALPVKSGAIRQVNMTRRSISQSDAEAILDGETASSDHSPAYRKTRRSVVQSEDEMKSPVSSAPHLNNKKPLKKTTKTSKEDTSKNTQENSGNSDVSPSPTRRSSRGHGGQVPEVKSHPSKKRRAEALKSSGSDSPTSDTPPSLSKTGHARQNSVATPTQPEKKTRTKTPSKDSPSAVPPRRSLRSLSETPSPRTRSGKVK